jgi:RimJ/RimL family protein N-acetyltransferase
VNSWSSPHIRLRAVEPSDAEILHAWNQDSERNRTLDFLWPPTSLASVQAFADEASKRRLENDTYHWIIETLEGVPVGTISTHNCSPRNGTFSYGVDVAKEQRGKGYAGEAIVLMLRYYFHELRYHKVLIEAHADNPASIHLHEKLGFTHEGTLREAQFTHGQHIDVHLYGMTRPDFERLYPEE